MRLRIVKKQRILKLERNEVVLIRKVFKNLLRAKILDNFIELKTNFVIRKIFSYYSKFIFPKIMAYVQNRHRKNKRTMGKEFIRFYRFIKKRMRRSVKRRSKRFTNNGIFIGLIKNEFSNFYDLELPLFKIFKPVRRYRRKTLRIKSIKSSFPRNLLIRLSNFFFSSYQFIIDKKKEFGLGQMTRKAYSKDLIRAIKSSKLFQPQYSIQVQYMMARNNVLVNFLKVLQLNNKINKTNRGSFSAGRIYWVLRRVIRMRKKQIDLKNFLGCVLYSFTKVHCKHQSKYTRLNKRFFRKKNNLFFYRPLRSKLKITFYDRFYKRLFMLYLNYVLKCKINKSFNDKNRWIIAIKNKFRTTNTLVSYSFYKRFKYIIFNKPVGLPNSVFISKKLDYSKLNSIFSFNNNSNNIRFGCSFLKNYLNYNFQKVYGNLKRIYLYFIKKKQKFNKLFGCTVPIRGKYNYSYIKVYSKSKFLKKKYKTKKKKITFIDLYRYYRKVRKLKLIRSSASYGWLFEFKFVRDVRKKYIWKPAVWKNKFFTHLIILGSTMKFALLIRSLKRKLLIKIKLFFRILDSLLLPDSSTAKNI